MVAVTALALLAPAPALASELVVFAAASLRTAMEGVADAWHRQTGGMVTVSYAASSALARQIEEGAPADIFISADLDWMDHLEMQGMIASDTRRMLLGNRIVLIAHGQGADPIDIEPGFDLAGLLGGERLAMADVEAVPAGRYGKAALETLGVWDRVADSIAQAENVRAALAFVALDEAPFGIVYSTDAAAEDNVTVAGIFPEDTHPPIRYPVAVTADSIHSDAPAFIDFLGSQAPAAIFLHEGFSLIDEDESAHAG